MSHNWHDKQVKADARVAFKLGVIHRAMNIDRVSENMDVTDLKRIYVMRREIEEMQAKYERTLRNK